ncbi:MAG: magnesium-translocating P-type ATPase, partial [Bdellovibrionota bacterium]
EEGPETRVFLGSSIVSGTARALVTGTGPRTAFGSIVARLAVRAPETEFDRGTRRFGYLIMETVFALVIFVFLANAMMKRDLLESLLFAVALAVGLTPEFLPVITAVTLGQGAVKLAKLGVVVKHLSAMQNFGSIDVLCSDKTGTLTSGEMAWRKAVDPMGQASDSVFRLGYISSAFETGIRSPLDQAILAAKKIDTSRCRKLDEVPFDFERRRLSVVVEEEGKAVLITKGAPEGIFAICSRFRSGGEELALSVEMRASCEAIYKGFSENGMRVLAVASRSLSSAASPVTKSDEVDLTLEGFLAFFDPPLEHAGQVIRNFRRDGVKVKILTGDNELVARHVCQDIGIDSGKIIFGQDIEHMTDSALAHVAEANDVFARVSPAHKNRIILALKSRKHVVGFMGDGINDAPSLHAADVGISFSTAVDVARETADIVLLKRDLRVLHQGILEGRKAFGNVMKYLLMGTSSNFGNMFSMAAASIFLPFLPMLPVQILLNNFLYDLAQITIPTDHVDKEFIRKPRHWDISLVGKFMLFIGPISSVYDLLTFYVLLRVFRAPEALFHTGWFVESLITQTVVIFSIRTFGSPFKSRPSGFLAATVLGVTLVGMLLPISPFAKALGFVPLPVTFFAFLGVVTVTYLSLVELVKRHLMK